jgi:CRP/FNR family cyclic AMP-dependent transcriptional regulator
MKPASQEVCVRMKKEFRFFTFLNDEEMKELSSYFECRQASAGEVLWREGDTEDYEAFIVSGHVEALKETEFKGKQVVVGIYSHGSIVGELCILNNAKRAVTAVAQDDVNLLILSRENFERVTKENPELGVKLLKGMLLAVSVRLRKSFERLASLF